MQHTKYIRLYADERGESHFEDLEMALVPVDFARPAAGGPAELPHPAPRRQIFCILQGECEVTASDGGVRRLSAGSVLLLEDTWGKGHSTRITSQEDVLIFAVVLADSQTHEA